MSLFSNLQIIGNTQEALYFTSPESCGNSATSNAKSEAKNERGSCRNKCQSRSAASVSATHKDDGHDGEDHGGIRLLPSELGILITGVLLPQVQECVDLLISVKCQYRNNL